MTTKDLRLTRHLTLCFALLLSIASVNAVAQDAASQTKAEIERLQQSLKDKPIANADIPDPKTKFVKP